MAAWAVFWGAHGRPNRRPWLDVEHILRTSTPLDESTRKALANLLIYLWGECGAKLPDYDKKACNAVMGQLKQIGAFDW